MKMELCCKKMLDEWNVGNFTIHYDGSIEWMDIGDDLKYCPFCGERFCYEVSIKNEEEP